MRSGVSSFLLTDKIADGIIIAVNEQDGVWRTICGRRVFIKKGQSLTDAMRESGKFDKAFLKTKQDKLTSQGKLSDDANRNSENTSKNKNTQQPSLSKQEYATLRAEVLRKNVAQKGKVKPIGQAFTANYFYIYLTKGDDDFTVVEQFDIEENWELINELLKGGNRKK